MTRLDRDFFTHDVLEVAPGLLGKLLVRQFNNQQLLKLTITETEAYRGEEDKGCHASKGRTPRTEIMYHQGGRVYVYLIYGIHWLLNFTTGHEDSPQAVLIRGTAEVQGPGRIGRKLQLDKSFYGEDLIASSRIWLENHPENTHQPDFTTTARVGIDYAGDYWAGKHWRFCMK